MFLLQLCAPVTLYLGNSVWDEIVKMAATSLSPECSFTTLTSQAEEGLKIDMVEWDNDHQNVHILISRFWGHVITHIGATLKWEAMTEES